MNIKNKIYFFILGILCNIPIFADTSWTILPLKFISGIPIAVVEINGYEVELIVDLGTTKADLALSKQLLDKVNANFRGIDKKSYLKNYKGEIFPYKNYEIRNFSIGDFKLQNLKVTELPEIKFFSDNPHELSTLLDNGTIGINLLKNYSIIFDYPNKNMILTQDNHFPIEYKIDQWDKIHFYYGKSGSVLSKGKINGFPVVILWDTGNSESTIDPKIIGEMGLSVTCPSKTVKNDNIGCILKTQKLILTKKIIGPNLLSVHASNPEADISLGETFFKENLVYFDFDKQIIAIKKGATGKQ